MERGGLAWLGLAIEARRDHRGRMLVRGRGDGKRAFPASIEGVCGSAAAVLPSAARELPDETVRRLGAQRVVDPRGDLGFRIRVEVARGVAIDERRRDRQVTGIVGRDGRIGARRQIGLVRCVRVRRQLRAEMTGWKDRRDG